jgi:nitrogen fixation NifU-like protein
MDPIPQGTVLTLIDHARSPRNCGPLLGFNGHARITGPCGDTMEFWLLVEDGKIDDASFATSGCGSSRACGSMATSLAKGRLLCEATDLAQEDVLWALGGLPKETEHCALLAIKTLRAACEDYLRSGLTSPSGVASNVASSPREPVRHPLGSSRRCGRKQHPVGQNEEAVDGTRAPPICGQTDPARRPPVDSP